MLDSSLISPASVFGVSVFTGWGDCVLPSESGGNDEESLGVEGSSLDEHPVIKAKLPKRDKIIAKDRRRERGVATFFMACPFFIIIYKSANKKCAPIRDARKIHLRLLPHNFF